MIIFCILKSLNYNVFITTNNLDTFILTLNNNHENVNSLKIKKIIDLGYTDDFVYDIETEHGRFNAGIGEITVKNTDSVFINFKIADLKTGEKMTNHDALKKAMKTIEPEIVFHLAASGVNQSADIQTAININVIGTANLLQSLLGSKIEQFVHTGTCHEYGDNKGKINETTPIAPRSIYAGTKAASTAICLTYHYQYGFPITILRPFVAYGPFANIYTIISTVILNALRGENIPLSSGSQKRDFVYIGDVVDAYAKAAAKKANGEIINVGSGVEYSIKEVVTKTLDLMGTPVAPLFGALPDRKGEIWHLQADNSKAQKILCWKPKTSLAEGLKRTIKWFKANKHFYGDSAHE